jgi:DNA excision repair protein ERCC-2
MPANDPFGNPDELQSARSVPSRYRVSVRGLVEHSLRSGDLDREGFGLFSTAEPIRAHQRIQASRPEGYRKEVAVFRSFERGGRVLEVHGRIDGVLESQGETIVEEIKTTRGELEEENARETPTHWGQVQVYAFLYAAAHHLPVVVVRLTYCHLDTFETLSRERRLPRGALEKLTEDLVGRYLGFLAGIEAHGSRRDGSIAAASFPFGTYRSGQREMAVASYRTIRDGGVLLIEAATGIGKTAAALFPALKALPEGKTRQVLYLTARTTGRSLAEKCLEDMRREGACVRSVTLTARDRICFNPEKACNGEECVYARGFYDRIDSAVQEALELCDLSRESIESVARKHRLCPFELSLELSAWCDVLICDYNYVFDPRVSLDFLLDGAEDKTLLVDEAHNLVDRAREMFSAEVTRARFETVAPSVAQALTSGSFPSLLTALGDFAAEAETRRDLRDEYFEASWFLKVAGGLDETYAVCGGEDGVKLFCRDPAPRLRERFSRFGAAVLFSATLAPRDYFRRTLGLEDAASLSLPSPFPSANLRVLLAPAVSTTYRRRADTEDDLVRLLTELVRARAGNYLFYFPSYSYLETIHRRFVRDSPDIETAVQIREMPEPERAAFLARFERSEGTFAAFAVLGGFFGEAIDLPGDQLVGAAVVGPGLPALSPERERIREHFERDSGSGFDYAYLYPGMNRVLQAAGRILRSENDRGVLLLVDPRFQERRYRSLFPGSWKPSTVRGPGELRAELERFWSER